MTTNSTNQEKQSDVLREQISSSLEKAQVQKNALKRTNSRYTTANIILGVLATLLAGTAGIIGKAKLEADLSACRYLLRRCSGDSKDANN